MHLIPSPVPLETPNWGPDDKKHLALLEKYFAHEVQLQKDLKDLQAATKEAPTPTIRMSLAFKDLCIWINEKKPTNSSKNQIHPETTPKKISIKPATNKTFCNSKLHPRPILTTMSAKFSPGTLTTIIGPSGSGKTTLLNFLSQQLETKFIKINGSLYINGKKLKDLTSIMAKIGYVTQSDNLNARATVDGCFSFNDDMLYAKTLT
jgi:ABC-type bacteriocin/lantibiotic exporter with double-glycine peptidase domain